MRARRDGSVRTGQMEQFYDWFWGHPNRFCRYHCDRDRRRQIATYSRAETKSPPSSGRSAPA